MKVIGIRVEIFILTICILIVLLGTPDKSSVCAQPEEVKSEYITGEKILEAIGSDVIIPCGMIGLEHYYVPSPLWKCVSKNKFRIDAICANCGKKIIIMIDTDNPKQFDLLMEKYYTKGNYK